LLDVLFRDHGYTRYYAAHEWHARNRPALLAEPKLTMSAREPHIPFANEGSQMVADRTGRFPTELSA
jgi:hypothetical protein